MYLGGYPGAADCWWGFDWEYPLQSHTLTFLIMER